MHTVSGKGLALSGALFWILPMIWGFKRGTNIDPRNPTLHDFTIGSLLTFVLPITFFIWAAYHYGGRWGIAGLLAFVVLNEWQVKGKNKRNANRGNNSGLRSGHAASSSAPPVQPSLKTGAPSTCHRLFESRGIAGLLQGAMRHRLPHEARYLRGRSSPRRPDL